VFDSVGWGEILVLVVAGLFILGPERLPSAAAWLGQTIRQVRQYATGAREQLRNELGPEFDELLVRTVTRAFPAREHERFVAHYRGLLAAWVRDQR